MSAGGQLNLDATIADPDDPDPPSVLAVLDLPDLTSVGSSLVIHNTSLRSLRLASLRDVDGEVSVSNNLELAELDLGSLAGTRRSFSICGNPDLATVTLTSLRQVQTGFEPSGSARLTSLRLPGLAKLDGELRLEDVPSLASLELPRLTCAGDLILSCPALTALSLPALTELQGLSLSQSAATVVSLPSLIRARSLSIGQNAALTWLDLDSLAVASVSGGNGGINIYRNAALAELALPKLTKADRLTVSGNSRLSTVSAPALTRTVGGVSIGSNPALTSLELPALTYAGGGVSVSDNGSLPRPQAALPILRMACADAERVPSGLALTPGILGDLARRLPQSAAELRAVPGIDRAKAEFWGPLIFAAVAAVSGDTGHEIRLSKAEDAQTWLDLAQELRRRKFRPIFRVTDKVLETHRERLRAALPTAVLRPIPPSAGFASPPTAGQLPPSVPKNYRELPPCVPVPESDPPGGGWRTSYVGSGVPASQHPLAKTWFSRCMNCASTHTLIVFVRSSTFIGRVDRSTRDSCDYECKECGSFTAYQMYAEY